MLGWRAHVSGQHTLCSQTWHGGEPLSGGALLLAIVSYKKNGLLSLVSGSHWRLIIMINKLYNYFCCSFWTDDSFGTKLNCYGRSLLAGVFWETTVLSYIAQGRVMQSLFIQTCLCIPVGFCFNFLFCFVLLAFLLLLLLFCFKGCLLAFFQSSFLNLFVCLILSFLAVLCSFICSYFFSFFISFFQTNVCFLLFCCCCIVLKSFSGCSWTSVLSFEEFK